MTRFKREGLCPPDKALPFLLLTNHAVSSILDIERMFYIQYRGNRT